MTFHRFEISKHAVDRYRQRVVACPLIYRSDALLKTAMMMQLNSLPRTDSDKIDAGFHKFVVDWGRRNTVVVTVLTFLPWERRWRKQKTAAPKFP